MREKVAGSDKSSAFLNANKSLFDRVNKTYKKAKYTALKDFSHAKKQFNAMSDLQSKGKLNFDSISSGGSKLIEDLGKGNKMKGMGKLALYGAGASAILDMVNPFGLGWGD